MPGLGCAAMAEIRAEITANVWKIVVEEGQAVAAGDEIAILESMKMEIPVVTETAGTVRTEMFQRVPAESSMSAAGSSTR
mgnify:CR=1 FL=1